MPILRARIHSSTHNWNLHRIRRQRTRPHVVSRKPFINYYYSEAEDHKQSFDHDLLQRLQQDVQE
jgi:hypothetical protein